MSILVASYFFVHRSCLNSWCMKSTHSTFCDEATPVASEQLSSRCSTAGESVSKTFNFRQGSSLFTFKKKIYAFISSTNFTLKHAFQTHENTKFWRRKSVWRTTYLKDSNSTSKPAPFPLQLLKRIPRGKWVINLQMRFKNDYGALLSAIEKNLSFWNMSKYLF